jgi:hypothetical protein
VSAGYLAGQSEPAISGGDIRWRFIRMRACGGRHHQNLGDGAALEDYMLTAALSWADAMVKTMADSAAGSAQTD